MKIKQGIKGFRWMRPDEQRIFIVLDQAEGIKWLRKAAEQGHAEAQFQLGTGGFSYHVVFFHKNEAVFATPTKSPYKRSPDGEWIKDEKMKQEDDVLVSVEPAEGIAWLHKAAEQGHVEAQFTLGIVYYHGLLGTFEDRPEEGEAEAIKWFRKAAEQGHEQAAGWLP